MLLKMPLNRDLTSETRQKWANKIKVFKKKHNKLAVLTDIWAIDAPADHAQQKEQIANEVSMISGTCKK